MALDVRAAVDWLRPHARRAPGRDRDRGRLAGRVVSALAAADARRGRGVALISPSLDYRGVRLDAALEETAGRPVWLVASTEDPYALRTVRELASADGIARAAPERGAGARHGAARRDPDLDAGAGGLASTDVGILRLAELRTKD